MIADIADLIEELAKERTETTDPVRRIYAIERELAAELGRRMCRIREEEKKR